MKNKKGETIITIVFWVIIFGIVFFMFGAQWLGYWSISAVEMNNLTGAEAFILSNMPLIFVIIIIISILAYTYLLGGNQ